MSPEWWPHDDEPYMLIDAPDEGQVEEQAHIPVRSIEGDEYAQERAAGGLEAAALAFVARYQQDKHPLLDADYRFALTGTREWWRPLATPTEDGEWLIETTGAPDLDDENGAGARSEYCPWARCEADAVGAVEFYVLEVVEA